LKVGFRSVFDQLKQQLIDEQTALEMDIQQSLGDQNYYLSVTLPSLFCKDPS
jgi:hypothetical protein